MLNQILAVLDAQALDFEEGIVNIHNFIHRQDGLGCHPLVLAAAPEREYVEGLRTKLHKQMPPNDRAIFPLRIDEEDTPEPRFTLTIHPPNLSHFVT